MYSRGKVCTGNLELSVCWHNGAGIIEVLRNGDIATGSTCGRFLNIAGSWAAGDAEARGEANLGIDGGCQSEEEYGSGEGLG